MGKVTDDALRKVEEAFDAYVIDLEASSLSRSSKDSYTFHGRSFVRWLKGEYEPGVAGMKGYWPDTIVKALRDLGGEAYLRDIEHWVRLNVALTPHELGNSGHGGRARYVHTVRATANRMARSGELDNVGGSQRPRYRLPSRSTKLLGYVKKLRRGMRR